MRAAWRRTGCFEVPEERDMSTLYDLLSEAWEKTPCFPGIRDVEAAAAGDDVNVAFGCAFECAEKERRIISQASNV